YTHVFPTATGNGIELAFANDFAAAALCSVLGCVVSGAALDSRELAAAAAVPPAFSPGTSGLVPFGTPPHPARAAAATMAAPARTTLAAPCLLIKLPRCGGKSRWPPATKSRDSGDSSHRETPCAAT